jgi:REP element-mobilizing transposase RayT
MWNLPPPPGFQGLREDLPLEVYVRHLPHWRQAGATYFVTFRLADSLPLVKLDELAQLRREWEHRHSPPWSKETLEQLVREVAERVERWLDQGMGSSILRDASNAAVVTKAMHHFDGSRYELGAYVVMPNHVHAIVRPLLWEQHPLESLLGSWKQYSATQIHKRIGGKGELWQDESYDRILRDAEHLWRSLQYMGRNPGKAGLRREPCPLWVKPQWVDAGWKFDQEE